MPRRYIPPAAPNGGYAGTKCLRAGLVEVAVMAGLPERFVERDGRCRGLCGAGGLSWPGLPSRPLALAD